MNETVKVGAPLWFKIISALFAIWNLFGLMVFVLAMTVFRGREALENAGLNEQQVDLTLATPTWVNVAFGIAVVFGVIGCITLLLRSQLAIPFLIVSLLGVLAQNAYMYLLSDTINVMGVGASPFVIIGAIAVIPYALFCSRSVWFK
ncbi:MAG: hypothetical protein AB8B50_12905 [Pirellulaceae bacterium]